MEYSGISASSGYAIGYALVSRAKVRLNEKKLIDRQQVKTELKRFKFALWQTEQELNQININLKANLRESNAEIVEGLLLILQDDEFSFRVINKISHHCFNAETALSEATDEIASMVQCTENDYISERSADIRDISQRLMNHLIGALDPKIRSKNKKFILITDELRTSYTAQLDPNVIIGCVSMFGGKTSHSAIIARSMGMPVIVGTGEQISQIQDGQLIILDGVEGKLYVDPDLTQINYFSKLQNNYANPISQYRIVLNEPTFTLDNYPIDVLANIDSIASAKEAKRKGADGIGLFRTEFLYLNRLAPPSEEEQFETYRQVAQIFGEKAPIIIRTLDIGGDKQPLLKHPTQELNPLLGYRGIRVCLDQVELFKDQLRAILRASIYGQIKIMFPMIALLMEWKKAIAILTEVKEELKAEGIAFNSKIEIGMMIEVPAAALNAEQFAQEVDFFSIGTNDLIQYMMAVDRSNASLSYLNDAFNPPVLRLIQHVIRAAHKKKKWISMCGEMAGQPLAIALLLGMGLNKFSMNTNDIALAKTRITQLNRTEMETIAKNALKRGDSSDVIKYIKSHISDI